MNIKEKKWFTYYCEYTVNGKKIKNKNNSDFVFNNLNDDFEKKFKDFIDDLTKEDKTDFEKIINFFKKISNNKKK